MTGWLLFAAFTVMGFVDLILGFVSSRTPDPAIGEAPGAATGGNSPQARRFAGRGMMVSALFLWALPAASLPRASAPDLALPIFTQSVTE